MCVLDLECFAFFVVVVVVVVVIERCFGELNMWIESMFE